MDAVEIIPPDGPINATVRPPGSKSITNRALPIAAVAKGTSTLTGVLKSDDTIYMIKALKQLGVEIDDSRLSDIPEESVVVVQGCDGRFPATEADLFLGNSGTSIRFLTAMVAACGRGSYRLDGIERMRERPIGDLVDALRHLGVSANYDSKPGFPPICLSTSGCKVRIDDSAVTVSAGEQPQENELKLVANGVVSGAVSSQFLSGLLMALPYVESDRSNNEIACIAVQEPIVSRSYVTMTCSLIRQFGYSIFPIADSPIETTVIEDTSAAKPNRPGKCTLFGSSTKGREKYDARTYDIPGDASAASYWFAAGALGAPVGVDIAYGECLQGDIAFAERLRDRGYDGHHDASGFWTVLPTRTSKTPVTAFDFSDISDTAQTMAAVAVFADSPTTVTGVEHMRHKECDRVSAVVTELRKLGIECDEHQDGYTIYPGTPVCKEPIETYDDHRMAMSFALLGLKVPGIIIKDPDCVNKTYPRFWDDWAKVTGKPVRRFEL